jgi:outer membrane protein TolC
MVRLRFARCPLLGSLALGLVAAGCGPFLAPAPVVPTEAEGGPSPVLPLSTSTAELAVKLKPPEPGPTDRPMPINLATALQLANARPLDVAVAQERVNAAAAQLDRAKVLWLPNIQAGGDYFRHDGRTQDNAGVISDVSKSAALLGVSPNAVFGVCDAIFSPLAARQVVAARAAEAQAATNDSALAVAEVFFNVQQARGELATTEAAARRAADLVSRAEKQPVVDLAPPFELSRTRTESYRRQQFVEAARERWRTASAELNRLLRLDPAALVEPIEPPHLQVTLIDLSRPVDELIPIALTNRPELAAQQALVRAALERLRQEKMRPLVPSVLLRGASTNPTGTLGAGVFGGGQNASINNFGARMDLDIQLLWEFQNLGFGNKARIDEQKAEHRRAVLESFRTQDHIAAEVVQVYAQAQSAAERLKLAELALKEAVETADKSAEGMSTTKRFANSNVIQLTVRPQEAVAALQALVQASADYYAALGDSNRAQFRLYRALGQPAQMLLAGAECAGAQE